MSRRNLQVTSNRNCPLFLDRGFAQAAFGKSGSRVLEFLRCGGDAIKTSAGRKIKVPDKIDTGNILIEEGTLLPEALRIERESCVPGWRVVRGLDGYALDREVRKVGWTFFCLAGEIKATVFGFEKQSMMHRAIEQILAKAKPEKFNSLEITGVVSLGSEHFPILRCVTVSARSRHIQGNAILSGADDVRKRDADSKMRRSRQETYRLPGEELRSEEATSDDAAERVGIPVA